jgi:predicted membrane chloride channel (bestrophin family)
MWYEIRRAEAGVEGLKDLKKFVRAIGEQKNRFSRRDFGLTKPLCKKQAIFGTFARQKVIFGMCRRAWSSATLALIAALLAASAPRSSALSVPRPRSEDGREVDSRESFRADIKRLEAARTRDDPEVTAFKRGTAYTISVLWTPQDWDNYQAISRYWRYLRNWPFSQSMRITAPIVGFFTAWSAVVCQAKSWGYVWTMPLAPLTIVSSALVLLLTLRTNQALNRLMDARSAWGRSKNSLRLISSFLATRVYPVNPSAALLGGRLLCTVGWSLRSANLGKCDKHPTAKSKVQLVDHEALQILLPPEEAAWLGKQHKPVLAALDRLSFLLRAVADDPEYAERRLATESHRQMLENICELDQLVGACERLVATPVPPIYTRFTSRVLLSWLACVPPSLVGSGLPNFAVILGTFFTTYVMVGIDEIAIEIEEPMRLLPLNDLCISIMSDVAGRLAPEDNMPSLPWKSRSIGAQESQPSGGAPN